MGTGDLAKPERLLKRALKYVSDYWVPINAPLAERIREGIVQGKYDTDRILLCEEVSSDLGLFFGCIRQLRELLGVDDRSQLCSLDLTECLHNVDLALVRLAIENVLQRPSVHLMSEGEEAQVSRLLEGVIAVTTAGVVAPGMGETAGRASSVVALRQLGYALVAWNYQGVYREAVDAVTSGESPDIDSIIVSRLGFSPVLLAVRLAKSWGLPKELLQAALVPVAPLYEEAHVVSASHDTLNTICRISEAIARAQFEHTYPDARAEWDAAVTLVEEHLGPDGIEQIRSRCAETCRFTVSGSSDIFRPGLLLDDSKLHKASEGQEVHAAHVNPFVLGCSGTLRRKLEHLYRHLIEPSKPSERALGYLMREIVSAGEFSGGCIYTADPTAGTLMPQFDVGWVALRDDHPTSYLHMERTNDPVLLAFLASAGCEPVVVENPREGIACITSAFGRSQRLGVLYLEMPLDQLRSSQDKNMTHFRAVVHALVDCLGL